jgi:hypothetical protein
MLNRISYVCLVLVALIASAQAADDGCARFAWSVARERTWFAAPEIARVTSGDSLPAIPKQAFTLRLLPAGEAPFVLRPERKARSERGFGGVVQLPGLDQRGIYQVTLSDDVWLDIVQDGRYARSVGSTGRSDCPGIRKSVRLDLSPAPLALQVSGVATDVVVIAIAPAE